MALVLPTAFSDCHLRPQCPTVVYPASYVILHLLDEVSSKYYTMPFIILLAGKCMQKIVYTNLHFMQSYLSD